MAGNNSKKSFTLDKLLNDKELRNALQEFKITKTTNDTTKMKYLTYFEQMIKFLKTDVSSPEYSDLGSNDLLIAQNTKLKQIFY